MQLLTLPHILLFIVVTYFLLLILTPFNGTEMAFYMLMYCKEIAHSLTPTFVSSLFSGTRTHAGFSVLIGFIFSFSLIYFMVDVID